MVEISFGSLIVQLLARGDDLIVGEREVLVPPFAAVALDNLCETKIEKMRRGERVLKATQLVFDDAFVEGAEGFREFLKNVSVAMADERALTAYIQRDTS